VIPAHTTIGVPAHAIAMDPKLYPEPETFDGLRFARLRQTTDDPTTKGKAQFVSVRTFQNHLLPSLDKLPRERKAVSLRALITA
jgi:ent-kaurene oxidase